MKISKTLEFVLVCSLAVISFSFFYYFLIDTPNTRKAREKEIHLQNQEKCTLFVKNLEKAQNNTGITLSKYIFNDKLNTCLWNHESSFQMRGIGDYVDTLQITDVYSNKDIITASRWSAEHSSSQEVAKVQADDLKLYMQLQLEYFGR